LKNILIIGGGGREHALAWKFAQSSKVKKIFVAPGNAGTGKIAENVNIKSTDFPRLIKYVKENDIELTIVGPDDPLALGIVDEFRKVGLKIFGPSKKAARIESSKVFSKNLMKEKKIPTARFETFSDYKKALDYMTIQKLPIVIKASGLALGKGVSICQTFDEAKNALYSILVDKMFGDSGNEVVIEEFLGNDQELSIHCITDGKEILIFPTAQDHKLIYDGDKGLNTGGMGTYAPIPWAGKDYLDWTIKKVIKPALEGLEEKDSKFIGCLYPGLKLTTSGPKVLEFNARFGDPEAQSYMRLLKTDLVDIIEACLDEKLKEIKTKWNKGFAVCVIIASKGYPISHGEDVQIFGIEEAEKIPGIVIFHSGTKLVNSEIFTSGGRVLGVTAVGKTLKKAINSAYMAVSHIKFDGMQYRKDIGAKALNVKTKFMKNLNVNFVENCLKLLTAYHNGDLGQTVMPEDSNPGFTNNDQEIRFAYFSLPMALNYQRNSYKLWESALKTYQDLETRVVFDVDEVSKLSRDELRRLLTKYQLALQPNKHVDTWQKISQTVSGNWGSLVGLLEASQYDFLKLRDIIQKEYKKGFPYLSGPKIFNYWSYILTAYCNVKLKNSEFIDIAPDTHITKCSIILGVITEQEAKVLSKEEISERWRIILDGTGINPIDMHPPLWFWSRNGFVYKMQPGIKQ
jgi:phosphoribosylamine--glycine ligase